MEGRRADHVAKEGMPFLVTTLVAAGLVGNFVGWLYSVAFLPLLIYLFLIFRDPARAVPAAPLGVVSPVDGRVIDVGVTETGALGEAQRVVIQVNSLGTYTARCPVEGKIMDLVADAPKELREGNPSGLWVRTDEDDDMVLRFAGHRFGFAPRAFLRCGERVGQGQRCAYLRLTRRAEVELPLSARVKVSVGQRVRAGSDILAKLAPP